MTKAQAQKLSSGLSGGAVNTVFVQCSEETSGSGKTTKGGAYFFILSRVYIFRQKYESSLVSR